MNYPLATLAAELSPPGANRDALDCFLAYAASLNLNLYPAQEEATLALFAGQNVILNTPTGSGKSLVATALHFWSLANGRRSFYTCPIKALANEKFLALCRDFGPENVGMITGDASINAQAPIICCTAEILANLALREGDRASIDDIVMDEFHYYSDRDRGVAWQIPLICLKRARFMLMSATLGDMSLFEKRLTSLNGRETVVIKSLERPVPLKFQYKETLLHETIRDLIQENKAPVYLVSFTQRECAEVAQSLLSTDICTKEEKSRINEAIADFAIRFTSPYGKEIQKGLRHGIGLHHAGLLPKYRLLVERLAQRGLLKVICGTDTLGVGVNVPIRTVLFSKLCKYDGNKTGILTVRDFRQISGRAGRKGFDTEGLVVAQAPEHVVENLKLEAKAGGDPKKARKIVKKKPPEKGFVMWSKDTFDKLQQSEPEPLQSQFSVTHGMLLSVLSRPGDGCRDMRGIIRENHDSSVLKDRQRKISFQMFRSLIDRRIIEFVDRDDGSMRKGLRVNVDLQEDFSIHHGLALYLIDTVKLIDPYSENYALDILTLAESIVEDPVLILRKQLDKLKTEKMAEMKRDGVEFEERIAELEKLEHPKPNRDFIYSTFNNFADHHPWIGQENIRPKSVIREMFEAYMTFPEYVREYDLHRTEGLLLRYISEVYRVLVQTLPATAKDETMEEIIDYLGVMARQVDSTLLDEWEKLKGIVEPRSEKYDDGKAEDFDVTQNYRMFCSAIRNEAFQYVKALATRRIGLLVDGPAVEGRQPLGAEQVKAQLEKYTSDHVGPLADRSARRLEHFSVDGKSRGQAVLECSQVLVDEEGHNDWELRFSVDVAASRAEGRPILSLIDFREIQHP